MDEKFDLKKHIRSNTLLLDVRSPSEFAAGHIPGATSFPLFTDEERAEVGTIYKRQNQEKAVERGLEFVGPKMADMVREARKLKRDHELAVYCWRGGMRSESISWLLNTSGVQANRLKGGYKAFRNWVHQTIDEYSTQAKWLILSGYTGSGKTEILAELKANGEQVIDLEGLANHRGSAFGHLLLEEQPSTEHFMNLLAVALSKLDKSKPIWIEDESRMIGRVALPDPIFNAKMHGSHYVIRMSAERRAKFLVDEYGDAQKADFAQSFKNIERRLGGLRLKEALAFLDEGNLEEAAKVALQYYDKAYGHGLTENEKINGPATRLEVEDLSFKEIADQLTKLRKK